MKLKAKNRRALKTMVFSKAVLITKSCDFSPKLAVEKRERNVRVLFLKGKISSLRM